MKDSKTLFCCLKLPWTRERIYSEFIDKLDWRPEKVWPALSQAVNPQKTNSFKAKLKLYGMMWILFT